MSEIRAVKQTQETPPIKAKAQSPAHAENLSAQSALSADQAALSGPQHAPVDPLHSYPVGEAHAAKGHADTPEAPHNTVEVIAHKAHNPHAAMHLVEAGEVTARGASRGGRAIMRMLNGGGRAAAAAAELTHEGGHGHHGLLGKAEGFFERGFARLGRWGARGIKAIPGGERFLAASGRVLGAPGRVMGAGVDGVLTGTRLGKAVTVTGSGARFITGMGGRLPVIGSVLGGVIAAVDVKDAIKTFKDPKSTPRDKAVAGSLGVMSATSGVLGIGALGVAGAAAIGLTAPVSVPLLLGAAAVTGVIAFGLSFFKNSH